MMPVSPVIPNRPDLPETIFAKDQPEYRPLPAIVTINGTVTCRWRLTWRERLRVLWTGYLFVSIWKGRGVLQPHRIDIREPEWFPSATGIGEYVDGGTDA